MPSKPLTLLILFLICASVFALSREDWSREVSYAPANSPLGGMLRGPGEVVMPVVVPGETGPAASGGTQPAGPDKPAPPVKPLPPVKPVPSAGEAGVDIMAGIDPMGFSSKHGVAVPKTGVEVVRVKKTGEIVGGGVSLGEPEMIVDFARTHPGRKIVIMPDKDAAWELVGKSVVMLMKSGAESVGLGYKTGGKPMMLDIALPRNPVGVPEGMDVMKLTVKAGASGGVAYHLFEYDCENREELISLISDLNAELAETHNGSYSRDPSTTPWVVTAEPSVPAGEVLVVLAILRDSAVYSARIE